MKVKEDFSFKKFFLFPRSTEPFQPLTFAAGSLAAVKVC